MTNNIAVFSSWLSLEAHYFAYFIKDAFLICCPVVMEQGPGMGELVMEQGAG